MSRRNDTSKLRTAAAPNIQPDDMAHKELRRQAAQADIPQGPSKNQDKRSRG